MRSGRPAHRVCQPQRGFGYLLMLFAVAALGLGLAGAGQVWHTVVQREKEAQLLFIGNQFRLALASYYEHSPDGKKAFPLQLQDLVEDRRWPQPMRHLRRLYLDPMTGGAQWGLVRSGGRIVGVHSLSTEPPFRSGGFAQRDLRLQGAVRYDEWVFGYDSLSAVAVTADNAVAPLAFPTGSSGARP
jgi:type II secretory pathway pseudopilin PulG